MQKIISYNVNGIRAAAKKGLFEWVINEAFDIICFQETKARPEQVDVSILEEKGYYNNWHSAEKKGYSSVATFSKIKPDLIIKGCGIEEIDREGRILRTDYGDITLLNCYFPSGTTGDERQNFKYKFLDLFFDWVESLKKERPNLIICGDYNIAHAAIDIHNPKSKNSGFLPDERAWMTKWFKAGYTDAFRHCHPELVQYSWWTYRMNCRARNKGWRIDYFSVSDNLVDKINDCQQLNEAVHSDHCPVLLEIELLD